jgi:hypothetical protein
MKTFVRQSSMFLNSSSNDGSVTSEQDRQFHQIP